MGKHDKVTFSWEPPKDEFYKARINTLERENLKLNQRIAELETKIGNYELVVEQQEVISSGITSEYEDLLEEKNDEIEVLQGQIKMLKEAIVKGALREVLA